MTIFEWDPDDPVPPSAGSSSLDLVIALTGGNISDSVMLYISGGLPEVMRLWNEQVGKALMRELGKDWNKMWTDGCIR